MHEVLVQSSVWRLPNYWVLTPHHTRRAVRRWEVNLLEDARHWIGLLQYNRRKIWGSHILSYISFSVSIYIYKTACGVAKDWQKYHRPLLYAYPLYNSYRLNLAHAYRTRNVREGTYTLKRSIFGWKVTFSVHNCSLDYSWYLVLWNGSWATFS